MLKSCNNYRYKLFDPTFGKDELQAVEEVFKSGVLTQGQKVEELEKKFAEYTGFDFAVAVNSCTSALSLCLEYKKLFHNWKTVCIPSVTFVSVANSIIHAGLEVDFIDKIYVGHYYPLGEGEQCIYDSAHFLQKNGFEGSKGMFCFSFYPIKQLGGAEGGMITTNNTKAYNWLKLARDNGLKRNSKYSWDYDAKFIGWKMNMTDIQAAILLSKLDKLDAENNKRKEIRDYYNQLFGLNNTSLHLYLLHV